MNILCATVIAVSTVISAPAAAPVAPVATDQPSHVVVKDDGNEHLTDICDIFLGHRCHF